jgi:hypothetical protein
MDREVCARHDPANKPTEQAEEDAKIEYINGKETALRTPIGLGFVNNLKVIDIVLARQNYRREVNDRKLLMCTQIGLGNVNNPKVIDNILARSSQ